MDKRKILEDLKNKYNELGSKLVEVSKKLKEFEATPEGEAYKSYGEAEDLSPEEIGVTRETMYPEQYAMYKEYSELVSKIGPLDKSVKNAAKNLYKELSESTASLENKIKTNEDYVKKLEEKITQISLELSLLKDSEAFKNGDTETVLKVEELEGELSTKTALKDKILEGVKDINVEIGKIKSEQDELVFDYEDEIITVQEQLDKVEPDEPENTEPESEEPTAEEGKAEEKDKKKETNQKGLAGMMAGLGLNAQNLPDITEIFGKKEVDPEKAEFDKLYSKAKKGNLSQEDFDKLAVIMQDPSNYDKYGITTGVVFNKSKVILRAMANVVADAGTKDLARACNEKFGLKREKATKANNLMVTGEIKDWSGLKALMADAHKRVTSEDLFERVVATVNRDDLATDEEKEVWDNANSYLGRYASLRSALTAYDDVSRTRKEEKKSWFKSRKEEEVELLDEAQPEPEVRTAQPDILNSLAEQTTPPGPDDLKETPAPEQEGLDLDNIFDKR